MYIENIIPKSAAKVVSMALVVSVSKSVPSQKVVMNAAPVVSVSNSIPSQQVIMSTVPVDSVSQ